MANCLSVRRFGCFWLGFWLGLVIFGGDPQGRMPLELLAEAGDLDVHLTGIITKIWGLSVT